MTGMLMEISLNDLYVDLRSRAKCLLLGCRMAIPVGKWVGFFFRVGKSLACHSPSKWCLCA